MKRMKKPRKLGFMLILLFTLNIAVEEWLCRYIGNEYCEYFYGSIYVQLLSVLTFLFILNFKIRHSKIVSELSQLFLPVYTVHSFVIYAVFKILTPFDYWFMALISWILVSIISLTISYVIMKIPYMNKIFKI